MTTSQSELCFLTIGEASALIKDKKLSPVELTQAYLDRMGAIDGKVKSYVTPLPESALQEARVAEADIQKGNYRGPLHGVPIGLKDLYDTKGVRTTGQSKVFEHRVPTEDATVVTKLQEAGTVLLGKLAMHEFALGGPKTSLFEQAKNPWNLDHVTGGSSSGSGAAIAAGLAMGSLGSDTGGSIRGPAALCGIVGLKPTYGRVSRYGVLPLSWSLDTVGPMTWSVEDTALMLQVIAGHDPKDPTSSHEPVPDYLAALQTDLKGVRVGVPRHYFFADDVGLDDDTRNAIEKGIQTLKELGATVQDIEIPSLSSLTPANGIIMLAEANAYHEKNLKSQPENFGDIVRSRFIMAASYTSADYVQSQRARSRLKREFAEALQKVDVMAMPVMAKTAAALKDFDPMGMMVTPSLMGPFNLTGMPAMSVPCGFSSTGLPIGMQLAAAPFNESAVIRAGHAYQQHARWHDQRPSV
jgi:aspartyl-tRNA(Asn)/glutamyl-tRNA(Gln) amidotransferase subunit A